MEQNRGRPLAGTCAKGTLLRPVRTGALLVAGVLASVLMVDLPLPLGGAAEATPYVPAGETWIELGEGERLEQAESTASSPDQTRRV